MVAVRPDRAELPDHVAEHLERSGIGEVFGHVDRLIFSSRGEYEDHDQLAGLRTLILIRLEGPFIGDGVDETEAIARQQPIDETSRIKQAVLLERVLARVDPTPAYATLLEDIVWDSLGAS